MNLEESLAVAASTSNVICYVSPLIASVGFFKAGTTGKTASLPLVSTFISSLFWLTYGLLSVNSMLIRINGLSLALFSGYLAVYYVYCPSADRLFSELRLATYLVATVIPLVMLSRTFDGHTAMLIMGLVCNCLTISVYAAPLGTLREVIQQRNTSTMSPPLVLSNWFSAAVWASYGFVINDIFIIVPNSLGIILCTAQCLLFAMYPRMLPKKKES